MREHTKIIVGFVLGIITAFSAMYTPTLIPSKSEWPEGRSDACFLKVYGECVSLEVATEQLIDSKTCKAVFWLAKTVPYQVQNFCDHVSYACVSESLLPPNFARDSMQRKTDYRERFCTHYEDVMDACEDFAGCLMPDAWLDLQAPVCRAW